MPDAPVPPSPIKFPVRPSGGPPALTLQRRGTVPRSPVELSAASVEARKQIAQIVAATRSPFGGAAQVNNEQMVALERSLRSLETRLVERERAVEETEARQIERERDLAEAEALLLAREKLMAASRKSTVPAAAKAPVSKEEQNALEQLKAALDQQEASLKEQKAALLERERFMEENETKLFEKMMQQQEKETELEQQADDIRKRDRKLREREAALDPQVAAAHKAEDDAAAAKKADEFNE
jgi:hypothetical protein